jgi:peptide/nickel transport system substrate-binding protein
MEEKSKTRVVLLMGVILFLLVLSFVKAEAAAKPEGTLTVAVPTLGEEGFLPERNTASAAAGWECVYDYLIYYDSIADKPLHGLAERWEYSKNGLSLTFYLRKGIQFQDGWGELTAEDVKFTVEHITGPASTNIISTTLKSSIESMEVKDRYTLVIHLKRPDPDLWINFTSDNPNLPILCKKYIETVGEEKANRQPIGSGPYRFVESKLGEYSKFEALEKHWLVVPEFKYVIYRVVPEETTRVAMLKTGEVDIATELDIGKLPELEKAKLKTQVAKNGMTIFLLFGGMLVPEDKRYVEGYHRMDPWKDIRVREAMNIAIDRKVHSYE